LGASKVPVMLFFSPLVMGQSKWCITKGPIIVAFPYYCTLFLILGHKNPRLHISVCHPCTLPTSRIFFGANFCQNVNNKNKEGTFYQNIPLKKKKISEFPKINPNFIFGHIWTLFLDW
jgi:hypothetical protein